MQVQRQKYHDSVGRLRDRLQEKAAEDDNRSKELVAAGEADQQKASAKSDAAGENRKRGEDLKKESNRLRRNGREQSLRGLKRLANGSDRYAESFSQQEKGLADLQKGLDELKRAGQRKDTALGTIREGLSEQKGHLETQRTGFREISDLHEVQSALTQGKDQDLETLGRNRSEQTEGLQNQAERMGDFLLAGADFEQGTEAKKEAFQTLGEAVTKRVAAESLDDQKGHQEVQKQWAEEEVARHGKAESKLLFDSMLESLKAKAAELNSKFHQAAAERNLTEAGALEAQANEMKGQADALFQHARSLEACGQQHVAMGRQMQCCPWTYWQGVCLERQGMAELGEAQRQKQQADSMRSEAQAKALEAETARVRGEQAREVGDELQVDSRGHSVRSSILEERSQSHGSRSAEAREKADEATREAEKLGERARRTGQEASRLHAEGVNSFSQAVREQHTAQGKQGEALTALRDEVKKEEQLSDSSKSAVGSAAGKVARGFSAIRRGHRLSSGLATSLASEKEAQSKVKDGLNDFKGGLAESKEAADGAQEAADLLKQARELELEGLRLQNRGQKMLLSARPKMAQAANLSAQSFDAYKKAGDQEEEAKKLIASGEEKLAAAEILKDKAARYRDLAEAF